MGTTVRVASILLDGQAFHEKRTPVYISSCHLLSHFHRALTISILNILKVWAVVHDVRLYYEGVWIERKGEWYRYKGWGVVQTQRVILPMPNCHLYMKLGVHDAISLSIELVSEFQLRTLYLYLYTLLYYLASQYTNHSVYLIPTINENLVQLPRKINNYPSYRNQGLRHPRPWLRTSTL